MVKCSKIDSENVGLDLQSDSSTDLVVDSSDIALDKSEMEVIQVNNGTRPALASSEFMDVGVTDDQKSWIKVIRISQRSWIWKVVSRIITDAPDRSDNRRRW